MHALQHFVRVAINKAKPVDTADNHTYERLAQGSFYPLEFYGK